MNTKTNASKRLHDIQRVLLSTVSELDLRGADQQITKVMCLIDVVFDAAISGKVISAKNALEQMRALSAQSISE